MMGDIPEGFKRVGVIVGGLCLAVLASLLGGGGEVRDGTTLRVVFFDVGQGDSIFIESPTGKQVLVDSGPDGTVLKRLGREMGYFDRSLDMVIATHEDKDHVGGLPDVFNQYQVGTFVRTENEGESSEARIVDELSKREGSEVIYARRGMTFDLGASTTLEILFPDRDPSMLESNTSSIVARLVYGESSFLLTGDSPDEIEEHLVYSDAKGLESDVLKLGHHGSRTSSSELFLRAVQPQYAIISAGKDNRYGHPHSDVVARLASLHITGLNTKDEGSIVFESNGENMIRR
jgi:competence protein ComEC